jgi:uncharacterized membrane protein
MMQETSKSEAQQRADQIRQFQAELDIIEKENIARLDSHQRMAISSYHQGLLSSLAKTFDIDESNREKQLSLGMRIASFLGALGLAASVFFFFYQFWGNFTTKVQVLLLITAPLITLVGTIMATRLEATGYFSKIIGLVCIACFVLNLVMLGQIFNITPSENAFFVWSVFAFLLAYATDARLLLAAGIISFACYLSMQAGTWSGCYWLNFGERPENFFSSAIVMFMIPAIVTHKRFSGFDTIYRVFAMLLFFLPILILSNWGAVSYIALDNSIIEGMYQVSGFIFSACAIWIGLKKNWPDAVNTGNVFFVIFLYTKFYDWWWDWMPKYIFFLIIGLTAILALLIFKRLRSITHHVVAEVSR